MSYKHGVSSREIPTSLVPPVESTAGLPVVFGTAPINLGDTTAVNKPILAYTYAEAVEKLGYSDNFEDYTLCEFMSSHFSLFNVAPVVFVNVLDPTIHKIEETVVMSLTKGEGSLLQEGILKSSLVIKSEDDATTYAETAYDVEFNDDGYLNIFMGDAAITKIKVTFTKLDPTMVTALDIVGGVSIDGGYKGLELVNHVFPSFRLVPGLLVAPKFSADSTVGAVMAAKSNNINGIFKAQSLVDISTKEITDYTKVAEKKNLDNIISTYQAVFWPKVALGDKQYHLSTQAAGVINILDSISDGVPYKSPSNKNLQADSAVLADGKEITLGQDQAAYLNGQGVITALNFIGGWKLWGNRTAAYPGNSDPKDSFLAIRRMFNYIQNNLILTYWQKVDDPTNRKLIESVVDSENIKLNGMTARGYIIGGRVDFLEAENPLTDLLNGKVRFHVYIAPPPPAREIDFITEFDTKYISALFG